jgi:hypothetical protein
MSASLVFIVPVRHHDSVPYWPAIKNLIRQTLASIAAQSSPEWECLVVANRGADLPELPDRCAVRFVDLPLPQLPDRNTDLAAYYDAIRNDKGRRIYAGLKEVDPDSFVMVVDFDDFVHKDLAKFVSDNRSGSGWFIEAGYVYSGGGWVFKERRLYKRCGTSHVIRRKDFGTFEDAVGTLDIRAIKRRLGSHVFIKDDLAAEGRPLSLLPFPGAVYRIGNPQSTIGTGSLFQAISSPRVFVRHPLRALWHLTRYRRLTPRLRTWFGIPAV